jgi:succinate-semialdehyde dehydrogenase/glutarate-semialdehyde dehydrogenase
VTQNHQPSIQLPSQDTIIMPTLISKNPYTEEVNATRETISEVELLEKIQIAHTAYLLWKETLFSYRKELFLRLADELERDIDACARLETIEMGMLHKNSKA